MPDAPPPLIPLHLDILLSLAAGAIVIMAIFVITAVIYIKAQVDVLERHVTSVKTDVDQLIHESRGLIGRASTIAEKVDQQMDDVKEVTFQARQIAQQARSWVDRADNLVEQASPLIETPVFFLSGKFKTIRTFFNGVLQSLKNPQ